MGRAYPYLMREHPEPRPRDDKDAALDIARDLAEIASHIAQLKGDANAYLSDPNYNTLKLRLEAAHSAVEAAAVEARRRVRLTEGRLNIITPNFSQKSQLFGDLRMLQQASKRPRPSVAMSGGCTL
jgi:hypothetical protein